MTKFSVLVVVVLASLFLLAKSDDLNCRLKPGCDVNHCDPSPSFWNKPGFNIDEYLRKKQFPITCEAQKKSSSDDVLRLYASFADNLQDIRNLKQEFLSLREINNKQALEIEQLKSQKDTSTGNTNDEDLRKLIQKVTKLEKKNTDAEEEARRMKHKIEALEKKDTKTENEIKELRNETIYLREEIARIVRNEKAADTKTLDPCSITKCKQNEFCSNIDGERFCRCGPNYILYNSQCVSNETSCSAPKIKCGKIKDSQPFKVGSTITFKCNRGYKLSGDSTATCTADGSWNRTLPKCEETPLPFKGCPKGYKALALTCYRLYDQRRTYTEAGKICERNGGQLANIQSKQVNDFLYDNILDSTADYWIGLHTSDFNAFLSNGDAFEQATGFDIDLTNVGENSCGKYSYRNHWTGLKIWQIQFSDCSITMGFICEVWKSNAHSYDVIVTRKGKVAGFEGVYRPVTGLITYETKRQIYKNENDSKQYLFYDVRPGAKSKYWFIGGYDTALGKPSSTYKARTSSSVVEPDQINTPWVDYRRRRIDITISKTC